MDIEKDLLGHLTSLGSLKKVWDLGLRPQVFVDPVHRAVFEFSLDYWQREALSLAPTSEVLKYEFPSYDWSEPEESVEWLVAKLQERYVRNQLHDSLREVAEKSSDNPREALQEMFESSWALRSSVQQRASRMDMSQSLVQRRAEYQERTLFEGEVQGVPLGLPEVDANTYGLLPGELAAIIASTGTGKSHLMGWSARAARLAGFTPIIYTLEMNVGEFADRIDAYNSNLRLERITKGTLSREEVEILHESQEQFAELGPVYIEKPPRGERTVSQLVTRARQLGADCIYIDQLSFIEPRQTKRYEKKHEGVEDIMLDLKAEISEDEAHMIPCYLAAQFNREAKTQGKNGRGILENIGLSSLVEQTINFGFALSQSGEMRANRSMVLDVLKARRGVPSSWLLEWDLVDKAEFSVRSQYDD